MSMDSTGNGVILNGSMGVNRKFIKVQDEDMDYHLIPVDIIHKISSYDDGTIKIFTSEYDLVSRDDVNEIFAKLESKG